METIKSLIPDDLKRKIGESTPETLTTSCSSILDSLSNLPQFRRVIGDLTDPELALCRKNKEKAQDLKQQGNGSFSKGDYATALSFYSQALRYAPMTEQVMDESFVATIYVNRASSMHKMGLLQECVQDCNRAIALSPVYAKAWYRRGMGNASLKNYITAIRDLETSISMEGSSSGKKKIKEELSMIIRYFSSTNGTSSSLNDQPMNFVDIDELHNTKLECVATPLKGRGMVSPNDIPPASLLHSEEPLSAIVMKSCRETHCHFCFNEVPADVLFCLSCTIPIYCSQYCQEQAGGRQFGRRVQNQDVYSLQKNLSPDIAKHVMETVLSSHGKDEVDYVIPEHGHECGGAHWPSVLPTDVVLAGRVMAKFKEKGKSSGDISMPVKTLDFAHNYNQIPPDCKLELHIYAVVLSYCIQGYYALDFPSFGLAASQLILLISQIKVNSMAVVRMKSLDECEAFKSSRPFATAFTSNLEQVQVGQAIYSTGSLFNHSCRPNIHAYFLSRTLHLRSTEFVPAWYPLELSYGPQVGQQCLKERKELLKERYSFNCQCRGCSELTLSDLVINAFRCSQPDCLGTVLEMVYHKDSKEDSIQVSGASLRCKLSLPVLQQKKDVSEVAYMLLQEANVIAHSDPGHCLSCGSFRDLDSLRTSSKAAMVAIEKLKDSKISDKALCSLMLDALKSLSFLRSIRHPYCKIVAQAEDTIAEAFIKIGELEHAMQHCKESIKILEKIYGTSHIVIAHELMKLASIQLTSDNSAVLCNIERLEAILSLYYGPHATAIISHLDALRREADRLAA